MRREPNLICAGIKAFFLAISSFETILKAYQETQIPAKNNTCPKYF